METSNKQRTNRMKEVGLNIAKLRESRGLSQLQLKNELKEKVGLDVRRETITQWENGTRDLKVEYTIALADYFEVSCDEILRGIKSENVSIAQATGLSDAAITYLKEKKQTSPHYIKAVNVFLESDNFDNALFYVDEFTESVKLVNNLIKIKNSQIAELASIDEYKPNLALIEKISQAQEKADLNEYRLSTHLGFVIREIARKAKDEK